MFLQVLVQLLVAVDKQIRGLVGLLNYFKVSDGNDKIRYWKPVLVVTFITTYKHSFRKLPRVLFVYIIYTVFVWTFI